MHTKLIRPAMDGHQVYHNLGPADRLIAYLLHEAREQGGGEAVFFDQAEDYIDPERVRQAINGNVKGLRREQEKFFALVVAPSEDELHHIGNRDEPLKAYVRCIMEDYVRHFKLKDGHCLEGKDLLWFAVIHADRSIKNTGLVREGSLLTKKQQLLIRDLRQKGDPHSLQLVEKIRQNALQQHWKKQDGENYRAGDRKPGLHKHVHIVVSRQDKGRQYSLNPGGWKASFDLRAWQESNGHRFREMFGYCRETIAEAFYFPKQDKAYFDRKVEESIRFINDFFLGREKLDSGVFQRIGARYNYSRAFFINLGRLKSRFRKGDYCLDPYHFVARGRDIRLDEFVQQNKREKKSMAGSKGLAGAKQFPGVRDRE